ncbi:hypothetical protein Vadar_013851 [Vaccinium darrowii]|uniref:Uncharacterized protein n=1 Tax=Vaccinium darrowii TaxID=229202 RepID=A0ACB7ZBI5_9ERIC|nr:hypothetical protein Vadar_013851 [Vaccinium darrowii]
MSKWYLWLMWPVTVWSMIATCIHGRAFIVERNAFRKLKLQSWAIPRYTIQYLFQWQREAVSDLIEEAIIEADASGTKVLSLGLLNQGEEINRYGELYIQRYPQLKVKVVDGSSLVVAIVLNSIPKGTTQVLLRGSLSKVAYAIASALCQRDIQVSTVYKFEHERLKVSTEFGDNLVLSKSYAEKKVHNDCLYHHTPAMVAPSSLENLNSCENWLPRRAMSASRIAGIVHALEGWNVNECGQKMFDVEQVWEASLKHGFRPLMTPNKSQAFHLNASWPGF